MKPQIVNIVNFLRTYHPFEPDRDLVLPFKEQVRVMNEHSLRCTFLFAYDTLVDEKYIEIAKTLDKNQYELGIWLEFTRVQNEDAGVAWTSEHFWDWRVNYGFSVGYSNEEKAKLIDIQFKKFYEIFGYYPKSFGAWVFDAFVVRYINEHYNIDAMCVCRDQYGTDGFTLWGGYYSSAYYPSRHNMYMPAQTRENQIKIPIFRMLGSDPVYQYDSGLDLSNGTDGWQTVITLEPYCAPENQNYYVTGGGVPEWVDWFLKENFNGECLTFGYAQAGQENYLGWDGMKKGIEYQFSRFAELQKEGKITVETLAESGVRYKNAYDITPASTVTAHSAYDDENKTSVWYSSKNYRINLYTSRGQMRIRDIHVFDENVPDPYDGHITNCSACFYETLPVVDGYRYTGGGVLSGLYLQNEDGSVMDVESFKFYDKCDEESGKAVVDYGKVKFTLCEDRIIAEASDGRDFRFVHLLGESVCQKPLVISTQSDAITLRYLEKNYTVSLLSGEFCDIHTVVSQNGKIEVKFVSI